MLISGLLSYQEWHDGLVKLKIRFKYPFCQNMFFPLSLFSDIQHFRLNSCNLMLQCSSLSMYNPIKVCVGNRYSNSNYLPLL